MAAWSVLDHATSEFTILDETGRILYVNPANALLGGWDRDALVGQSVAIFLPAEFRERVPGLLAELLRSGSLEEEFVNVARDGGRRRVQVRAHVVEMGHPGQRYILSEVRDVSGQLEQLERLSATALSITADPATDALTSIVRGARALTQARYAALLVFDHAGMLVRFIPDGLSEEEVARIHHPPEGRGLLGAVYDELRTINIRDIRSDPRSVGFPAGHPAMVSFLGVPIRTGDHVYGQIYLADKQGATAFGFIDERLAELFAAHAVVALQNAGRVAELRISEERLRLITENANDLISLTDEQGRVVYASPSFERILGFRPEELIGQPMAERIHPDDLPPTGTWQDDVPTALRMHRADGSWAWIEGTSHAVERDGHRLRIGVGRDVTERRAAEQAVRERDAHLQELVSDLGVILWERDPVTLGSRYVSAGAQDILGYPQEQWVREPAFWPETIHPLDRATVVAKFRAAVAERREFRWEYRAIAADSTVRWLRCRGHVVLNGSGEPTGVRGVTVDITEERRLEAQARQSQKMEAIGQLAGGVAHDFNNLLTAIRGYGELVRGALPAADEGNRTDLGEIIAAADRAADLTRQLLAFGRRQVLQPRIVAPATVVDGIVPLLRRLLGEHIEIIVMAQPGAGHARVDPTQLEQVIVNLAVNARDAMPEGGRLTLETAAIELGADFAISHPEVVPGQCVLLAISDTGIGMDPETQIHIFEPFFTTKAPGHGTGLGLATVYGIVKQSGGWIYVDSEPRHGTTFRIYLPRVAEEATADVMTKAEVTPTAAGSETVLIVEDEPAVRAIAARVLGGLGHRVLQAPSGAEALALALSHEGPIDLLVTDVVMAGMQGRELATRLMATRPGIRVLYMSGFREGRHGSADLPTNAHFLPKPFSPGALGRAVRQALNSRA